MIVSYIFDLILYWASYNFLHIIKLNYINSIIGLDINQEFFNNDNNSDINNNGRIVENKNGRNLIFYLIIIVICLLSLKVLSKK
jgi:hypothetical protein